MIVDKISNIETYKNINVDIFKALEYLKNTDFTSMHAGRHEICGDKIFSLVNIYDTNLQEDSYMESHKKYIDIQYMDKGEELMGYLPLTNEIPTTEYNKEGDYMFFKEKCSTVKIEEKMFAIFFPQDIHMPGIMINESKPVRRIVVKVLI